MQSNYEQYSIESLHEIHEDFCKKNKPKEAANVMQIIKERILDELDEYPLT